MSRCIYRVIGMVVIMLGFFLFISTAKAEYGDVRINNYSEKNGMRPAVFPHWFHRIRFRCLVCHQQLGFKMKREANHIDMNKIAGGQFCGACHNGKIAWAPVYCDRCHTGTATEEKDKQVKKTR